MLLTFLLILILLAIRIGYIQIKKGDELRALAYKQQSLDRNINAKRGTIYDSKKNALAVSASVETVTINPVNISNNNKEKVAKALSDIFNLEYEKV